MDTVRWGPGRQEMPTGHMLSDRWPPGQARPEPPSVSICLRVLPRGHGGEREMAADSGEGHAGPLGPRRGQMPPRVYPDFPPRLSRTRYRAREVPADRPTLPMGWVRKCRLICQRN